MRAHIAAASAACVALSACNALPTPADVTSQANSVISEAKSICGLVATSGTVADVIALIGGMAPGVDSVESLANLVCAGVNALPTLSTRFGAKFRGAAPRTVRVYLHGQPFVVHIVK